MRTVVLKRWASAHSPGPKHSILMSYWAYCPVVIFFQSIRPRENKEMVL
jgi:hypothetical protein